MNSTDSIKSHLASSSILGVGRGIVVHLFTHPLDVVKTHQQSSFNQEKSYQIACRLLKDEGVTSVYRGLFPRLIQVSIKQAWCWPMIIGIPSLLDQYVINPFYQQTITGISIATMDAAITTPLDKLKIVSMMKANRQLSFRNFYKEGWQGIVPHWMKSSINWSTFLVAQKFFREQMHEKSEKLSLFQLMQVGTQVAFVVSIASAPFDVANTLKQSKNLNVTHLFSGNILRNMYRGWPLNAISLVIHNVASVILIYQLEQNGK